LLHAKTDIREFEWYVCDHLFRQYNQDKRQFEKESRSKEMLNCYLRYRNSNLQHLSEMMNIILENFARRVIKEIKSNSFELANRLSRLQCSECFYICYLTDNEPRNCSRCASSELHIFLQKTIKNPVEK
jgi:hypothetical protein